jgi:hypothetical protein
MRRERAAEGKGCSGEQRGQHDRSNSHTAEYMTERTI